MTAARFIRDDGGDHHSHHSQEVVVGGQEEKPVVTSSSSSLYSSNSSSPTTSGCNGNKCCHGDDNSSSSTESLQDDVTESLVVMRKQECTTYHRRSDLFTGTKPSNECVIDGSWRQRIIEWMYGVVDTCNLRRDAVAVAAYYLDMCLTKERQDEEEAELGESKNDKHNEITAESMAIVPETKTRIISSRREFQLCAMTALQLAIKVYETSTSFKLDSMVKLSRGLFTEKDVVDMELRMLHIMGWHVHPPTTVCFIQQYIRFIFSLPVPPNPTNPTSHSNDDEVGIPAFTRYLIIEVTRFLSEISVCVSNFVKYPSSVIALACLLIALEGITNMDADNHDGDDNSNALLPLWHRQHLFDSLIKIEGLNYSSNEVLEAFGDLQLYFENSVNLDELIRTITVDSGRHPNGRR